MRVNVYAEEMTNRIEIISKLIEGQDFTGLRFYLELPATVRGKQYRGPFQHHPGDDDSAAVTFWGKRDLRKVLRKALSLLDRYYRDRAKRIKNAKKLRKKELKEEQPLLKLLRAGIRKAQARR